MSSRISLVLNSFKNREMDEQVKIIMRFSEVFKSTDKKSIEDLLIEVNKDYGLEWESYISNANHFYANNGYEEKALDHLFSKFQSNTDLSEVYIKVISINNIYSTRLNDYSTGNTISTKEMAQYIEKNGAELDSNKMHPEDAVFLIGDKTKISSVRKGVNNAYSFASKYLSFTYRNRDEGKDEVPITDTYSRNSLACLKVDDEKRDLDQFHDYFEVMKSLKASYKKYDEKIGYKEIDAFLWLIGKAFSTS